jgi:hypothetical protein
VRGEGLGESPECGSEPAFWPSEVSDVEPQREDGVIQLSWKVPRHARRCRVTRLEGRVPADGEGEPLACDRQGARDSGVDNGKAYGYRIRTIYADPHLRDSEIETGGVVCIAEPVVPPPPQWRLKWPKWLPREPVVLLSLLLILGLVLVFVLLAIGE